MATAIGQQTVTAISRHYIMPSITDNIYGSNPLFFRINASKRFIQGGTQIEVPLMYSRFSHGGPYSGADVLPIVPEDTVKNGVWDWRQHFVGVMVDGLTLIKTDSPLAVANYIKLFFAQGEMEMAENLAAGIFSSGAVPKEIDGMQLAIDSAGTYAGINRSTNSWWSAVEDGATTVLAMSALQSFFGNVSEGGRHPTLFASQQANYNRYWNINQADQSFQYLNGQAFDEQLASAGFTNQLFNGVPWVVDSHIHDSNTLYAFNEDYIFWCVSPRADFYLEDFQTPVNQDAMVAKMLWAGNLIVTNCSRQGKMTALTS
jgi:hypothetical protein